MLPSDLPKNLKAAVTAEKKKIKASEPDTFWGNDDVLTEDAIYELLSQNQNPKTGLTFCEGKSELFGAEITTKNGVEIRHLNEDFEFSISYPSSSTGAMNLLQKNPLLVFNETFAKMDVAIREQNRKIIEKKHAAGAKLSDDGATLVATAIVGGKKGSTPEGSTPGVVYTVDVGDSFAWLLCKIKGAWVVHRLNTSHNATEIPETIRLAQANVPVYMKDQKPLGTQPLVRGSLQTTRSFGDIQYAQGAVAGFRWAQPGFYAMQIPAHATHVMLMQGSDGVCDNITPDMMKHFLNYFDEESIPETEWASRIGAFFAEAQKKFGAFKIKTDDVTVQITPIRNRDHHYIQEGQVEIRVVGDGHGAAHGDHNQTKAYIKDNFQKHLMDTLFSKNFPEDLAHEELHEPFVKSKENAVVFTDQKEFATFFAKILLKTEAAGLKDNWERCTALEAKETEPGYKIRIQDGKMLSFLNHFNDAIQCGYIEIVEIGTENYLAVHNQNFFLDFLEKRAEKNKKMEAEIKKQETEAQEKNKILKNALDVLCRNTPKLNGLIELDEKNERLWVSSTEALQLLNQNKIDVIQDGKSGKFYIADPENILKKLKDERVKNTSTSTATQKSPVATTANTASSAPQIPVDTAPLPSAEVDTRAIVAVPHKAPPLQMTIKEPKIISSELLTKIISKIKNQNSSWLKKLFFKIFRLDKNNPVRQMKEEVRLYFVSQLEKDQKKLTLEELQERLVHFKNAQIFIEESRQIQTQLPQQAAPVNTVETAKALLDADKPETVLHGFHTQSKAGETKENKRLHNIEKVIEKFKNKPV